nr:hypothetical protein [Tanacetum cinerariifolium]
GKYDGLESSIGTSTKKTDCPFQFIGQYSSSHDYWTIRVVCDQHNHLPTQNLEGHAYARRLSDDEYRLVEDLTWKNVRPREILSTLKDQNENNLSTLSTIYDAQHKIRKVENVGKTPMQVLMSLLHINLIRRFSNLNIVHGKLRETSNIFVKIPRVLKYVHDNWLDKYKQHFVSAWIDRSLNSGNRTTNRVESQHAKLKDYMTCHNNTLDKFVFCIDKIVKSQLTAINESFGRSEISRYHKHNIPCFSLLRGVVLNEALDLMVKETERSNGLQLDSSTCGEFIPLDSIDIFWRTLNLSPATSLQSDNIRCGTEINQFKEHFNKQSVAGKRSFLRKLVDIFNPSKTTMKPPAVKKNTRERPSLKKQKKYAPPKSKDPRTCSQSARIFGIDLNTEPKRHSSYTNYQTNYDRDPIPDLNEEPARHSSFVDLNEELTNFFDYILEIFHPHIIDFYDMRGDGNCGFRSVALGLGLSEDQQPQVRSDLVWELTAHREQYKNDVASRWEYPYLSRQDEFREFHYRAPQAYDIS